MKNLYKKLGVLVMITVIASCDFEKGLENPNEVNLAGADVDLLLNTIQLDFADFYWESQRVVAPLIRHSAMTGGYRYQTAYQPQQQDNLWDIAYRRVLINAQTAIPLAQEKNLTTHVAVAKILQAYTYLTLVDVFGDVPASTALKGGEGAENFNPTVDPGTQVYNQAITLLTEARTELAKAPADAGGPLARDVYYAGSRANWTALANTLELKAWLNISVLPARAAEANGKIATLLTAPLIDTPAEDFTYKYSATTVPDSRHPMYNQYYGPGAGQAGGYIATGLLYEMFKGKPDPTDPTNATKWTNDPRWRYYFYRQVGSLARMNQLDAKALGCTPGAPPDHYLAGGYPFCAFDPGFYGRDHGDASGTPPDGPHMTTVGVYPAGGRSDNNVASNSVGPSSNGYSVSTQRGQGANGAGILPIFMAFYTDYYKAEILARGGNTAGAKTQLATAINSSITAVRAFAASKSQALTVTEPSTTTYQSAVGYLYDNAANKLKVIGREYWIATFGNGLEAYNSYRRTSGPDIFQPALQTGPGPWMRSMIYSANYVNLNENATQKNSDQVNKVFWDGNADTLN